MKVRLYGELKKSATSFDDTTGKVGITELDSTQFSDISDVLKHLGIERDEVSHLFLDGEYSDPSRKLTDKVERLAIFPKDMSLLYKWYFKAKK